MNPAGMQPSRNRTILVAARQQDHAATTFVSRGDHVGRCHHCGVDGSFLFFFGFVFHVSIRRYHKNSPSESYPQGSRQYDLQCDIQFVSFYRIGSASSIRYCPVVGHTELCAAGCAQRMDTLRSVSVSTPYRKQAEIEKWTKLAATRR